MWESLPRPSPQRINFWTLRNLPPPGGPPHIRYKLEDIRSAAPPTAIPARPALEYGLRVHAPPGPLPAHGPGPVPRPGGGCPGVPVCDVWKGKGCRWWLVHEMYSPKKTTAGNLVQDNQKFCECLSLMILRFSCSRRNAKRRVRFGKISILPG